MDMTTELENKLLGFDVGMGPRGWGSHEPQVWLATDLSAKRCTMLVHVESICLQERRERKLLPIINAIRGTESTPP